MKYQVRIAGVGHCVGSRIVHNRDVAKSLGLNEDWFSSRTGIETRRLADDGENALTMSEQAVRRACEDAGRDLSTFGHETVVLHIQNGPTHFTPPAGVLLCDRLGLHESRALSIDGVCGEVINAFEMGALMLSSGVCSRVIISAGVDFERFVDPNDAQTTGLFGAGAGAAILEQSNAGSSRIDGIYWETQTEHWDLGLVEILDRTREESGVTINTSYYKMRGKDLSRVVLSSVQRVLAHTLEQAEWSLDDVDFMVTHQPNSKLLELALRRFNFPKEKTHITAGYLGNMGPASLLVALSISNEKTLINRGDKLVLFSVGLGVSCGMVAALY